MADLYWVAGGTSNWWRSNTPYIYNWSTTATSARSYPGNGWLPTSNDNVFFDQYSGSDSIRGSGAMACFNFSTVGFQGSFNPGVGVTLIHYGNSINLGTAPMGTMGIACQGSNGFVTYSSAGSVTGPYSLSFLGAGATLASNIYVTSNLTIGGNFTATSYNVNVNQSYVTYSGALNINMGSGTWTLRGAGSIWQQSTGATIYPETSTIQLTLNSGNDLTFVAGGKNYNNLIIAGTNGVGHYYNITGGGSFAQISYTKPGPNILTFDSATTVTNFSASGGYSNPTWSGQLSGSVGSTVYVVNILDTNQLAQIPSSGSIKIGDEIMTYTSISVDVGNSAITFGGISRGANGTNQTTHNSGDTVYIPYYLYVRTPTAGVQKTIYTTTGNGQYYAGMNSVNGGNTTGITYNNRGDGTSDYVIFQDINMISTGDVVKQRAFFNIF